MNTVVYLFVMFLLSIEFARRSQVGLKEGSMIAYELPMSSHTKLLPVLTRPFNRDKSITLEEQCGKPVPGCDLNLFFPVTEVKCYFKGHSENFKVIERTLPVGLSITGRMDVACLHIPWSVFGS